MPWRSTLLRTKSRQHGCRPSPAPFPPKQVKKGPVKEVILKGKDLEKPGSGLESLPIPIGNPGFEGGFFLTAPFCVTKDPETGESNIGTYRMMVKGKCKTGVSCPPAQHIGIHFRKAKEMGRPLEMAASAFDPNLGKIVIVVDKDIDPDDPDAVNWALSFRMQPHRDTRIITHKYAALDPSAAPPYSPAEEARFPSPSGCSSLLIDATREWDYPPVALPGKKYMEEAKKIWEELGLSPLKLKMPWYGYSLGAWNKQNEEEAELAADGEYLKVTERLEKAGIKI